jgi:hypothetical protein
LDEELVLDIFNNEYLAAEEFHIFLALVQWTKHNRWPSDKMLELLTSIIRFASFTPEQIVQVEGMKFIGANTLLDAFLFNSLPWSQRVSRNIKSPRSKITSILLVDIL